MDIMGDDEHHLDTPTKPPNEPEETKGQRGKERVEIIVSKLSRECMGSTGNNCIEMH